MTYILTFPSSHLAMKANKLLDKSDFIYEIIPTPREVSSECGFSLKLEDCNKEDLILFICENNINFENLYIKKEDDYEES